MKNIVLDFIRRGLTACGLGPIVLAILYLILQNAGKLETLTVNQVSIGILSLSALAFIAGGLNVLYQIERMPLMIAIFIHGVVLYICYLLTYLLNDWLGSGMTQILMFTGIFVFGYLIIWIIIYFVTKRNTDKVNEILKKKQECVKRMVC